MIILKDLEQMKLFFGFDGQDKRILNELHIVVQANIDEVINELYQWMLQFDEVKFFFQDRPEQEVKCMEKQYFLSLTSGSYDVEFFKQRLQAGKVHKLMGVLPHLFLGAYSFYLQKMLTRILGGFEYDLTKRTQAFTTLVKLASLDQALIMEGYLGKNENIE